MPKRRPLIRASMILWILATSLLGLSGAARAETITIAVAANFATVADQLAAEFTAETGTGVQIVTGATGALFTQIAHAAPYDIFLAADLARPRRAAAEGRGDPANLFTYAIGQLALTSKTLDLSDAVKVLAGNAFAHLAIADPDTAPYGAAALQTLDALGLSDTLKTRMVTGTSVTQALQFVATGNAELGFVALSQVQLAPANRVWIVPQTLYQPIEQGAILLTHGKNSEAAIPAKAFVAFLQSSAARAIISKAGYALP